jgi:hypothetical protein
MHLKTILILTIGAVSLSLLNGCGGPSGVRVTEGNQPIGNAPTGTLIADKSASIVHVNEMERLATLRNARMFKNGIFLETRDRQGNKTATLKLREAREGLRTADIVEGLPKINDRAVPVSASENARLNKIYRTPVAN